MITAVDTSILLDIALADAPDQDRSWSALSRARQDGSLIISDIVIAEISPVFRDKTELFLQDLGIAYQPTSLNAALAGGKSFASSLKRGGKRGRIVADFLIGAHAMEHADRLLTRDQGFNRTDFKKLKIWYP